MFSSNTSQVSSAANYIEDVFSTYLYTGNNSTQTITNGIDLSTKGGLVWMKDRSTFYSHALFDTVRGGTSVLATNLNDGASPFGSISGITFNSNGFYLPDNNSYGWTNTNNTNYVSWTFREQPKFFDIVTYTGNSNSTQTISHNLGSTPGCIIIKATVSDPGQSNGNWIVFHRSTPNNFLMLNRTDGQFAQTGATTGTSTTFNAINGICNGNGITYVAYLFAHDAGGFGLTGTDNVISCGSFTVDGSGNSSINLGYEPQWLLMKQTNTTGSWLMQDTMRGQTADNGYARLLANTSGAETSTTTGFIRINATGFSTNGATGLVGDHIYIAIRRGPMKTPTTGTSVFAPVALNSPGGTPNTLLRTTNFPVDFYLDAVRDQTYAKFAVGSRLQGTDAYLATSNTSQETFAGDLVNNNWDNNTGLSIYDTNGSWNGNGVGQTTILEAFQRAPGFFDVVCYTGTGSSATSYSHNLGVAPELIINKVRSASGSNWIVTFNFTSTNYVLAALNLTIAGGTFLYTDGASIEARPTSTAMRFTGGVPAVNDSGQTYVAYLFASCPGVSKVGSYTGTGTTLQIDCGFTGGARFVLIKRTDSTGDWYVWDSARGIVSGNDPYLLLNSTAAEVTNTDYIDTYSAGFEISSTAPAAINANGGTFVFLAVA